MRWQRLPDAPKDEKFTLLIFGGSAGAHRINMAVLDALEQMTAGVAASNCSSDWRSNFSAISKAYQALPFDAEALPFIDRMDDAYARRSRAVPSRRYNSGGAHGIWQSGDFNPLPMRDL